MSGQLSPWRNGHCDGCGTHRTYRTILHRSVCAEPRGRGEPWFGMMRRQKNGHRRGCGSAWCLVCMLPWQGSPLAPSGEHLKALDRHIACFRIFVEHPLHAVARRT